MNDSPTARMIADAIEASGRTQREIADEMGLTRSNIISMLKSGEMQMPIERIPAFSRATGIDPLALTRVAMTEYMPETWKVLSAPPAPVPEAQLNVRAPVPVIDRFRTLCRAERRSYGEMLAILIERWETAGDRAV